MFLAFLFLVWETSLFVDLGNRILNIQNGKILVLLPVSVLYEMFILLWKLLVFDFAIVLLVLKWIMSVFIMSIWLSLNSSNLCSSWHTHYVSSHMLDIFGKGGWVCIICMGLLGLSAFLAGFVSWMSPAGLLLLCPHKDLFACNFACISYSCNLTLYLYLHVVIIYIIDKLLFYLPLKFLIIAFFCSYS